MKNISIRILINSFLCFIIASVIQAFVSYSKNHWSLPVLLFSAFVLLISVYLFNYLINKGSEVKIPEYKNIFLVCTSFLIISICHFLKLEYGGYTLISFTPDGSSFYFFNLIICAFAFVGSLSFSVIYVIAKTMTTFIKNR